MRPDGGKQRRDAFERSQVSEPEAVEGPGATPGPARISNQRLARAARLKREEAGAGELEDRAKQKTVSSSDEAEDPKPPASAGEPRGDEESESPSRAAGGIRTAAAAPPPPARRDGFALPRWGRGR